VTECAPMPIFRYRTLTVCYLLDRQSQCCVSVTSCILPFTSTTTTHYDFFTKLAHAKFVVTNAILC